jgi:hypothetical protein
MQVSTLTTAPAGKEKVQGLAVEHGSVNIHANMAGADFADSARRASIFFIPSPIKEIDAQCFHEQRACILFVLNLTLSFSPSAKAHLRGLGCDRFLFRKALIGSNRTAFLNVNFCALSSLGGEICTAVCGNGFLGGGPLS